MYILQTNCKFSKNSGKNGREKKFDVFFSGLSVSILTDG